MAKFGFYQTEHKNNNFFSFLQKQMWERPESAALKWISPKTLEQFENNGLLPSESLTIKVFGRLVNRVAQKFLENGIREKDTVLVAIPSSYQFYLTLFALAKIGAVSTMFDQWDDLPAIQKACERLVHPRAIITYQKILAIISQEKYFEKNVKIKIIVGNGVDQQIDHQLAEKETDHAVSNTAKKPPSTNVNFEPFIKSKLEAETVPVEQEHPALVIFSSQIKNPTGDLIGPNRTHRYLAAQFFAFRRLIPHPENCVELSSFPLFILNNLAHGVTTILAAIDPNEIQSCDGKILYHQLINEKVTRISLWPRQLIALGDYCRENQKIISTVDSIISGGGILGPEQIVKLKKVFPKATINILYGHLEAEPLAKIDDKSFLTSHEFLSNTDKEEQLFLKTGICLGQFDSGVGLKIIRANASTPVTINDFSDWAKYETTGTEFGELIVAGEHVCRDYYDYSKKQTHHPLKKIVDDFGITWHRTGDLVRMDAQKRVWFFGPLANAIEFNGKFYPNSTVESLVKNDIHLCSWVSSCAYFEKDKKVFCVVCPEKKYLNQAQEVVEKVKAFLTSLKLPYNEIIIKNSIPLMPHQLTKINYEQLKIELKI
jgi:acyl-CoA synthetase (AMP-forming)/AMP-acid ligase II